LMFAVLPLVVALLWLLHWADQSRFADALLDLARLAFPGQAIAPIEQQAESREGQADGSFSTGVAISLVVSLWAITMAFRSSMQALNTVYGVKEGRSEQKRLGISLVVAVVSVAFFLVALVLIVFGTRIADSLVSTAGFGVSFQVAWSVVSWSVVIASAFLAFACTYYFAPDVDQELRWIRFGSLAAVAMWLTFTLAFSVYVNYLSAPEETYGALAGIAVFMLYLYGSTFIVLLGAEMNQVLEHAHPEGKDDGEKNPRYETRDDLESGHEPGVALCHGSLMSMNSTGGQRWLARWVARKRSPFTRDAAS
jgi:membrane protein